MNRFLRVAYIVCFIYTLVGIGLEGFLGAELSIFCFAALYISILVFMLAGIIPALERFRVPLRALGVILAVCGALPLLHEPIAAVIAYALLAALSFVLASVLKYDTIHRDFASKFQFSLVIMVLIVASVLLLSGGTDTFINQKDMRRAVQDAVPCVIVTLAMGVLLLRGLRASSGIVDEKKFNIRQLTDTLAFFVFCIAFWAVDALELIKRGLTWFLSAVITPVAEAIAWLLGHLYGLMVNRNPLPVGTSVPVTAPPTYDIELTPPPDGVIVQSPSDNSQVNIGFVKYIAIITVSVLALVIIWITLSRLLKRGVRGRSLGYPNETREDIADNPEQHTEKPISRFNRDPRMRIRYVYQEFMRHLRSGGTVIERSDTCGDIESRAGTVMYSKQAEISELSEIYRAARYDMESEPSQDAAARARRAYGKLRNK